MRVPQLKFLVTASLLKDARVSYFCFSLKNDQTHPTLYMVPRQILDKMILTRQFKTAITWKLTFPPADSQWAIFEKSTKII